MKFPAMFSPIRIGTVTVPNRFVVPPMGNNFANTDGSLSDRSLGYYQARAKGGFGLITIESTVVYQEAKGGPRKPCLFSDDTVPSFRRVADACHAYGAKVSIQLQHAGPEGSAALTGFPLKAASAMPASAGRDIPEAVSNEEIYRIIECYGDAARRAQQAGIDMVEVHCAHGYLVSTFISQRTNHRTDEFGGCFENRMRLPRLIIENIRRKTGGNLPILCRINASDEVEGGQSVQDAAAVAAYLEQECGVDALHVTRAVHLHDEFMWAPGVTHGGFNADLVTEIKRAVSVPVIAVGRFTEPQYAELLVKQGRADLIAFGRQSIADPDLPVKARTGELETLAPCIGCLLGCVPNMFAGKPITCAVNPCVGRETELTPAAVSKRVVVVGGGPGGMQAALLLKKRGYHPIILESSDHLGGSAVLASKAPCKGMVAELIETMKAEMKEYHIEVRLNTPATVETLRTLDPYGVVVACGGEQIVPNVPGADRSNVYYIEDVLMGRVSFEGKNIAVIGGGNVAIDVARAAVRLGAKTTVVYRRDRDAMPAADDEVEEAIEEGVKFMFLAAPAEISGEGKAEELKVEIMELKAGKPVGTGKFETLNVSAVISAIGQKIDLGGMQCIATGAKGEVKVSLPSYQTSVSDVFAGGDVVTGPKFAIDAIAAGKEGAVSIHRYVHPGQSQVIGRDRRDYKAMNTATAGISVVGFDTAPRQKASAGSAKEAKKTFKDLRGTLTEEQMKIETSRCLGCGAAVVDESLCVGCGICTTKCKFDAIRLEKVTDYVGAPYFKALLGAAGNAPAAVAKLVTKKIARK